MKTNSILNLFNEITDETTVYGGEFEEMTYDFSFRTIEEAEELQEKLIGFVRDVGTTYVEDCGKWVSYIVVEMLMIYLWAKWAGYVQSQEDMHTLAWSRKAIKRVAERKAKGYYSFHPF